jgi:hypothetical protein
MVKATRPSLETSTWVGSMIVCRSSAEVPSYLAGWSWPNRLWRQAVAHALTVVSVVLVSLAYATVPDPTWISGIYDDADFDDVVRLATDGMGASECLARVHVASALIGLMLLAAPARRPVGIVRGQTNRGPPSEERSFCLSPVSPRTAPDHLCGKPIALRREPAPRSHTAVSSVLVAPAPGRKRGRGPVGQREAEEAQKPPLSMTSPTV